MFLNIRRKMGLGVSQEFILGPLLFILYIKNLSKYGEKLKFIHFADQKTVTVWNTNINRPFSIVQQNLDLVGEKLISNQLMLNTNKSSHMIIINI